MPQRHGRVWVPCRRILESVPARPALKIVLVSMLLATVVEDFSYSCVLPLDGRHRHSAGRRWKPLVRAWHGCLPQPQVSSVHQQVVWGLGPLGLTRSAFLLVSFNFQLNPNSTTMLTVRSRAIKFRTDTTLPMNCCWLGCSYPVVSAVGYGPEPAGGQASGLTALVLLVLLGVALLVEEVRSICPARWLT